MEKTNGLKTRNDEQKPIILNKNGPIVIIEDDVDDQEFLTEIFQKLNYQNEILFCYDHAGTQTIPSSALRLGRPIDSPGGYRHSSRYPAL